ncbi:MAG: peroxiredoxin [Candidatus Eremiobacteraeota bacterium]|nr:peroxiredoxin [Candidatus Eremiobacteraeota bacterium]MBV9409257.1 peroxiredoxin [Candidatus Eremiobacteraeota bacterium]
MLHVFKPVVSSVLAAAAGLLLLGAPGPAEAALTTGATAPTFTAQAAKGGDVSTVDLKAALAKGPVVLYFFPKSFTSGCTTEAHLFSAHIADFKKLGATVIGVSGDDIDTQKKFSTQECRSAFLVASDPGLAIAKQYDAVYDGKMSDGSSIANRTSYVIAKDGTVAYTYTSMDPSKHVENTLAALQALATK